MNWAYLLPSVVFCGAAVCLRFLDLTEESYMAGGTECVDLQYQGIETRRSSKGALCLTLMICGIKVRMQWYRTSPEHIRQNKSEQRDTGGNARSGWPIVH